MKRLAARISASPGRSLVAATLALALCVLGYLPRGEHVPLIIVEGQACCVLSYSIIDVVADPTTGAPSNKATGEPLRWQPGYTAWRIGNEIEVREPGGAIALRTPGRYRILPTWPDWVVGEVQACWDCELGGGPS